MVANTAPWEVVDGHYPCFREIKGPSFRISIVIDATDLTLADSMKREADAQLISAAPELLAALTEYIAAADNSMTSDDDIAAMIRFGEADKAAREAIAKATSAA